LLESDLEERAKKAQKTFSSGMKETFKISSKIPRSITNTWSNYAGGVVENLWRGRYKIGGADIYVDSKLPATGVSSLAVFEQAVAYSLLGLY